MKPFKNKPRGGLVSVFGLIGTTFGALGCVAFGASGDGGYDFANTQDNVVGEELEECEDIPWGNACQEGTQIYNVTFDGLDVATGEEGDIALSDIHCDGFDAVILFTGDTL